MPQDTLTALDTPDDATARVEEYERELRRRFGVAQHAPAHFRRPAERPFTAEERSRTTILFDGMTAAHDSVVEAALEGLGYHAERLPTPDNEAQAIGKEFCSRGECNPTYYTVGTLLRHLQLLRARGERDIEDRYVFVTFGACGPCRFGMYESEYRKALADAGFPNFRVIIMSKNGDLEASERGTRAPADGLVIDAKFYMTGLRALVAADIIKATGYAIRPYEVVPGATDIVVEEAYELLRQAFRARTSGWEALRAARHRFNTVDVDYTRVRPRVKMTGEFWALTTEGDGSYRLQSWLESEGAEVVAEPVSTWVEYMIEMAVLYFEDRRGIVPRARRWIATLRAGGLAFRALNFVYRSALDFRTPPLANQGHLMRLAEGYFNPRLTGGEGHMEVGKHIVSITEKKAHMVVSVKPFGCMPSTQSDGVQTKVAAQLPDSIFIPVETTGDGEVNVKSRVQMKLFEAKVAAQQEFERALREYGLTVEDLRAHQASRAALRRPLVKLPHRYAGTAANFVARVASDLGRQRREDAVGETPAWSNP